MKKSFICKSLGTILCLWAFLLSSKSVMVAEVLPALPTTVEEQVIVPETVVDHEKQLCA